MPEIAHRLTHWPGCVELPAGNVKFAAGLNKLVVALPDSNLLQRWDLATLSREAVVTADGGKITTLAEMSPGTPDSKLSAPRNFDFSRPSLFQSIFSMMPLT